MYNYNGDNMKIIICGVGKLGQHLAKTLAKEDYSVTVIDNDQLELEEFTRIKEFFTEADISKNISKNLTS